MRFTCGFCGRGYTLASEGRGKAFAPKCRACGHDLIARPAPAQAARQGGPDGAGSEVNPFVAEPVMAPPPPPAPEPAAAAPPPPRKPAAPPPAAPDTQDDLEDLGRTLAEVLNGSEQPVPWGDRVAAPRPAAPILRTAMPHGAARRASAGPRMPRIEAWPPSRRTGSLALPLKPAAGPRIALGVAALAVVSIVVAVLLLPRRDGDAPPPPSAGQAAVPAEEASAAGPERPPALPGPGGGVTTDVVGAPRTLDGNGSGEAAGQQTRGGRADPGPASVAPGAEDGAAGAAPAGNRRRPAGPGSGDEFARTPSTNLGGFDVCLADAVRRDPVLDFAGRQVTLLVTPGPNATATPPAPGDAGLAPSGLGVCLRAAARRPFGPAFAGEPQRVERPLVVGSAP